MASLIWIALALLVVVIMAPLALVLRTRGTPRGRREAAMALHRAQLAELDRDLADGRIGQAEHATAMLEVQRRLLAADASTEPPLQTSSRGSLIVVLALVPAVGFLLYIIGGHPTLPSASPSETEAAAAQRSAEEAALISQLRTGLAKMDPKSDQTRQGYLLLGNAEASRGNMREAAAAWGTALAARFDPTLAVETAEAITESQGRVTDEAASLFRRALAEAPADAPWRTMAQKRLGGS
jgi:cytochrome c-type biogenesis protein CcmH